MRIKNDHGPEVDASINPDPIELFSKRKDGPILFWSWAGLVDLSKDLYRYGRNTQISHYEVGGTQKPS